ncbi:MAG: adenylate/guanylate cyclase domain-containing protein [Oculatellaceae cyanobacterium bins.114]|nr:adenylate/guanylate cyclase domain-containing protein [Oculatellaceae cyanobacterium bins.114]
MSFKRLRQLYQNWHTTFKPTIAPGLKAVFAFGLTITSVVIAVEQIGWLEPLELRAYDRLVRLRPDEGADPRLLIVAITEEDLQSLGRATPSDQDLATALGNLQQHHPQVIGLDLHRDLPQPPGHELLRARLQDSNIVVITKLSDGGDRSVPPPPDIPYDRIGFNDLPIDPDGIIRRNLMFASMDNELYFSFSLRLATQYLRASGIKPQPSLVNPDYMQLGHAVFVPLEIDSGGYQHNDDRGYQVLLNYRSSQNIARQITLTQVLHNDFDPSWVRDKIILIGTTAVSGKDLFYTPFSASAERNHQMAGVAIHAQNVSQILSASMDQRPLMWFWAEWAESLWIVSWAIAGSALVWHVRHPINLGFGILRLSLLLSGTCFAILMCQGWVPLVAPMVGMLASAGTMLTYRAQQSQRQQQMVMTLLGQNTSPEIANALWAARDRLLQSGKLPGQKLVATMLFTDIKDFSTVSEQMSPEALLDWLNEYLEAMTQEIQRQHGIVNKFTGDGLLAVFGVPIPRVNDAEIAQDAYQAVACALAMGDRLHQLNQAWQQRGLKPVQMRVGIFTGEIVVGSLGGKDRMEYGVIGDSVNTASRLESCAKDRQTDVCRVLIAQETLDYLQNAFQVESWGPMALKGKQQLVNVYRVISHMPATSIQISHYMLENELESSSFEAETKANSVNL